MTPFDKDMNYLTIALTIAERGTCVRRKVGCVVVDRLGQILSTGYNGRPRGMPNCNADDKPCMGASSPSGTDLHLCEAVHAEQNALMQCADVQKIDTIYVTVSPCIHCMKMIINTSCRRIVYNEIYSEAALDMWDDHCARLNHV